MIYYVWGRFREDAFRDTANLRAEILDFGRFDSSGVLILRLESTCPWGISRKFGVNAPWWG